jgi:hypothetical protein
LTSNAFENETRRSRGDGAEGCNFGHVGNHTITNGALPSPASSALPSFVNGTLSADGASLAIHSSTTKCFAAEYFLRGHDFGPEESTPSKFFGFDE